MSYLLQALTLLIQVAFSFAIGLFVIRVLAEACRAEFQNPLSQLIYRYTNPVVTPIRRWVPNWKRVNLAAVLVAWLLSTLSRGLQQGLLGGRLPAPLGLVVLGTADLIDFTLVFYVAMIFGWTLSSLFGGDRRHPAARLLGQLIEPLLRPWRGRLAFGGIDFSPTVVMLALLVARILVVGPLRALGYDMGG
ncbi:YggT family protein [Frateuria aurantia]|uniref:Putative integral membrane protein n=1 Tax=Frateuria aurantia (strain ATCC 33424 / DSM 6220 / KCTC 2777 / LMG 1558 / NBRC 3245 / NCIMB 13370) TaxID=767434 RepID=H8L6R2_FRAAD|nr:YggT family protein [Frateuria aurantia]AFC86878.1 putative integral membrane protein [Frateuria aurantia DSM 6220]